MLFRRLSITTAVAVIAALLLAPAALAGALGSSAGLLDWTATQFTTSAGAAGDRYGQAVAVDGDTAAVGAFAHDVAGNEAQGAVYVSTRVGGAWSEQAVLTADDGKEYEYFGRALALDGDTLAVGAPGAGEQGAVYIFMRVGDGSWVQQAKLTGPDTSGSQTGSIVGKSSDEFGTALSLRDDVLVVGAPGENGVGAVYVYYRSGVEWVLEDTITSAEATEGQSFGISVSYDGDTLAVGAAGRWWELDGYVCVYVFEQDQWQLQAKLTKPDDAAGVRTANVVGDPDVQADDFGYAVSLKGDTLAVGSPWLGVAAPAVSGTGEGGSVGFISAPGNAYVYHRYEGAWSQAAELVSSDPQPGDQFGLSVALAGDLTVCVGAPGSGFAPDEMQGVVYAYDWTGQIYQDPFVVKPTGGAAGDALGAGLAVDQGAVFAGAPGTTVGGNEDQGAAWLFTLPGPAARVKGHKVAWQDAAVRLRFSGTAAEGGAAVDYVQYRVGTGDWTTGTSLRVRRQGVSRVQYRAVDVFGTRGPVRTCRVRIDTKRPTVAALAATAKAGTIARMTYTVKDPRPSSGTARVRLVVENAAGAVVTRSTTLPVTTNARHTVRIKALRLSPGTYTVLLHAVDRAGNAQKGWSTATLTVK